MLRRWRTRAGGAWRTPRAFAGVALYALRHAHAARDVAGGVAARSAAAFCVKTSIPPSIFLSLSLMIDDGAITDMRFA